MLQVVRGDGVNLVFAGRLLVNVGQIRKRQKSRIASRRREKTVPLNQLIIKRRDHEASRL
jgi:hypothetical protein